MTFPKYADLRAHGRQSVKNADRLPKIAAIYTGLTVAAELIVFCVSYYMDLQIDKTGGLANMGLRSILATLQGVLPPIQMIFALCLEFGFLAAAVRISRGMYTSPMTLKAGLDRFFPVLKLRILIGAITGGAFVVSIYLGGLVFALSPLSGRLRSVLVSVTESGGSLEVEQLVENAQIVEALSDSLIPICIAVGIAFLLLAVPVLYRYRLAQFFLLDNPGRSAIFCLRESRLAMRRHRLQLLGIDLRLWWYYGAMLLAAVIAYGDLIAPMVGIRLPGSGTALYFLFYILYLIAKAAVLYFFRCYVLTVYAQIYDALRPQQTQTGGAVLGSIFQR